MAPLIPNLRWPLEMTDQGTLAVVEHGSLDEVRQSVQHLLATPLGSRLLSPDVGVPDFTFAQGGIDPEALTELLTDEDRGEPRADIDASASSIDGNGRQTLRLSVQLADGDTGLDPDPTIP